VSSINATSPDPAPLGEELEAVAAVLDAVQAAYRDRVAGGIRRLPGRPESWGFVGARTTDVLTQLRIARRAAKARSPRFLECGSGFGFVTALARELGFTVTGIEIVPAWIQTSRQLFPSVPIEQADLLTFDRFGEFDVVYYYGPFADDAVQAAFERRIEAALPPGGLILANRKVTRDWETTGAFDLLWTDGLLTFVLQKKSAPLL